MLSAIDRNQCPQSIGTPARNPRNPQRESAEAYIKSQAHEGWKLLRARYDDGGLSGGTMERPALQRLLADIAANLIDVVVVYKVDRLTRSLTDFAKLVEIFEARGGSLTVAARKWNCDHHELR
jgi:site-specific DNA recombinase